MDLVFALDLSPVIFSFDIYILAREEELVGMVNILATQLDDLQAGVQTISSGFARILSLLNPAEALTHDSSFLASLSKSWEELLDFDKQLSDDAKASNLVNLY